MHTQEYNSAIEKRKTLPSMTAETELNYAE